MSKLKINFSKRINFWTVKRLSCLDREIVRKGRQEKTYRCDNGINVKLLIERDNKSRTESDILTGSADSRSDDRVLGVTGNGPWDDLVRL